LRWHERSAVIVLCGMGWIDKEAYMCVKKNMRVRYKDSTSFDGLARTGIFSSAFKNFGRLDEVSKLVCYAVALALKDAGEAYDCNFKKDMGLIGTNADGSLQADIDYFRDYLESGRKLSRGNLFLYTIPTSPLGEAAIHFGLQGPVFYMTSGKSSLEPVVRAASEMLMLGETQSVLAGTNTEDEAAYIVLVKDPTPEQQVLCDVSEALPIIEKGGGLRDMSEEFLLIKKGKGIK
jgi:3-oxoacyl-(acyl-carrier-protein) synthase